MMETVKLLKIITNQSKNNSTEWKVSFLIMEKVLSEKVYFKIYLSKFILQTCLLNNLQHAFETFIKSGS